MEENNQQGTAQAAPSLGVQDLLLMFQVIQVVAQRGGFRADELSNVGALHDRLKVFLTSAGVLGTAPTGTAPATDGNEVKGDQS
jgi:hypothetical protein